MPSLRPSQLATQRLVTYPQIFSPKPQRLENIHVSVTPQSLRQVEYETPPALRIILLDGIQGWLASPDPAEAYNLDATAYAAEFTNLINQQNKILRKQMFLRRFSWEWSNMQARCL